MDENSLAVMKCTSETDFATRRATKSRLSVDETFSIHSLYVYLLSLDVKKTWKLRNSKISLLLVEILNSVLLTLVK